MALQTGGFARSSTPINPGLVDPRLLAAQYDRILEGAGQGLQLVGSFGQLQDQQIARENELRTREAAIAAKNARARLALQQSGADLELLPQETAQRAGLLQLNRGKLEADLSQQPRATELSSLQLDTNLGKSRFELETQPRVQALQTGELGLKESGQKLEKQKQELESLTMETQRIVADETQRFMKENPEITRDELEAKLLTNQRLINHAKALADFEKKNPDFIASGAAAELAGNRAKIAIGEATVKSGGIAPAAGVVNPNREFMTRSARNLADADKVLNFGSLEAITAFQSTPEGKRIVADILSAPPSRPYSLSQKVMGKGGPADQKIVDAFRAKFMNPQQAPTATPSPAPIPGQPAAPKSKPAAQVQPPAGAIQLLRQNPQLAPQFEAKYGVSAQQFLQ